MREIIIKTRQELSKAQKQRLEASFIKKHDEECEFIYEIDSIIGGIVVVDKDVVYDASIDAKLFDIQKSNEKIVNESRDADVNDFPMLFHNSIESLIVNKSHCGHVTSCADGIITISGLADCEYYELLVISKNKYAIAMNLMTDCVKAMVISPISEIEYGEVVFSTKRIVEVPVGDCLIGRIVNPLGKPIDNKPYLRYEKTAVIESPAPAIMDRSKVDRPLQTGILAIDSMIPIGKGQRELIIGDRQTGKTSIAIDTILNQKGKNVICVYVAVGKRASSISQIYDKLKKSEAMDYTVMVVSTADESTPLQYIAPYTGCTIAEEFMKEGKDVLIVYDDLTKHANAYRTISLLLKRPSGREAYPGDVFYIHSRLLERSAQLSTKLGGGSLTALPIIETQAGDISQYIPTNVISITDGQIYLETELFNAGVRPAVNVGLSVSRVGGSAQSKTIRKLSSKLRLDLAHYRELALFTQFGADVDEETSKILDNGEKIVELLKQNESDLMGIDREIIYLYLINGYLGGVPKKLIKQYIEGFYSFMLNSNHILMHELLTTGELSEENRKSIEAERINYTSFFKTKYKL